MTRSQIMSRITGDHLKPESTLSNALLTDSSMPDFTRNNRQLPGSPDFSFPDHRLAVFVHGCFWHGCPKHRSRPKTRAEFWAAKFEANRLRDQRAVRRLRRMGWSTMVVWEHDLKKPVLVKLVLERIWRRANG